LKNPRKILEFLGTRNGTRAVAFVAAVVVWYAIRAATSNSTLVTDVPLAIQPPADWSVVECSAKTIDVAFLGTRDDLRYLNRELIKAAVDARAHGSGEPLTVALGAANVNTFGNARIDFIRPATVTLRLDRKIAKQVPVKVETQNLLPDGYEIEKTVVTPATVELSGPAQILDGVEIRQHRARRSRRPHPLHQQAPPAAGGRRQLRRREAGPGGRDARPGHRRALESAPAIRTCPSCP
jgi:YbbR domain-containing protein